MGRCARRMAQNPSIAGFRHGGDRRVVDGAPQLTNVVRPRMSDEHAGGGERKIYPRCRLPPLASSRQGRGEKGAHEPAELLLVLAQAGPRRCGRDAHTGPPGTSADHGFSEVLQRSRHGHQRSTGMGLDAPSGKTSLSSRTRREELGLQVERARRSRRGRACRHRP